MRTEVQSLIEKNMPIDGRCNVDEYLNDDRSAVPREQRLHRRSFTNRFSNRHHDRLETKILQTDHST